MSTVKTAKALLLTLVVSAFMMSCGGNAPKDPKGVAEAFLNAMNEQNFNKAKEYATEDSQEALQSMADLAEMGENLGGEKPEPKEIVIGDVEENGDEATVHYTEDGNEMTLDLVKEDGDWKVKFDKMGGLMNDMEDTTEELTDSLGTAIDSLNAALDSVNEMLEDTAMEEIKDDAQ